MRARMTASDLVGALAAIPGVRRLAAASPIVASVDLAGIEVAAVGGQAEAALRRTWRERHRGAIPLLMISDEAADGVLITIGPADADGPRGGVTAGR